MNAVVRGTWVLLAAVALCGCAKTASIDILHAQTSGGWFNGASLEYGTLYRWNIANSECVFLDNLPFEQSDYDPPRPFPRRENSLSATVSNNAALEFSANVELTPAEEAAAKAALTSNIQYNLKNYTQVTIYNTKTRMSGLLNDNSKDTSRWEVRSGMQDDSPLRYVVVYKGKSAELATLQKSTNFDAEGKLDLSHIKSQLKGEVKNENKIAITGMEPPALINVYIYKAYLKSDPDPTKRTVDFKDDSAKLESRFFKDALSGNRCN